MNNKSKYIVKHGPKAWVIMSFARGAWWESKRYETRAAARIAMAWHKECEA